MKWTIENSRYGKVNVYEGTEITLLSLKELQDLKRDYPETILIDIFGKLSIAKNVDENTRGGYVAFAILEDS